MILFLRSSIIPSITIAPAVYFLWLRSCFSAAYLYEAVLPSGEASGAAGPTRGSSSKAKRDEDESLDAYDEVAAMYAQAEDEMWSKTPVEEWDCSDDAKVYARVILLRASRDLMIAMVLAFVCFVFVLMI